MEKKHLTRHDVIMNSLKSMSRRNFLKLTGITAASIAAAATPTIVMAEPVPSNAPEAVVLDVWYNTDVPDLFDPWVEGDNNNAPWKNEWYWGGQARTAFIPWLNNHPGVSLKITGHSWDAELRQNQLDAISSGHIPDTTYGEAYVGEFTRMGVYRPVSSAKAALFPDATTAAAHWNGNYFGLPSSTGADVLFINTDKLASVGLPTDAAHLPTTWDQLLAIAQTVSANNYSSKWGNTAYYTYGPAPLQTSYGLAMRILHWFNQNGAPLDDGNGYPSANGLKAAQTWAFHNALLRTSSKTLIEQAESEGGSGQLFNEGVIALKPGWTNDATLVGQSGIGAVAVPFPTPPGGKLATIVIGNQINSAFSGGPNPDLAQNFIENVWAQVDAQEFLTTHCAIWVPALKSILQQYATYNKLNKFGNNTGQDMVRVTMKAVLDGGAGPLPTWPKNGSQCWLDWNNFYAYFYEVNPPLFYIQSELNHLQWQLLYDSFQHGTPEISYPNFMTALHH